MILNRPIYVLDTNVLVDYADIIPGEGSREPIDPTIDFSDACIVVPSVVVRELSNFKKESSDRGIAARKVLRRLRSLVEKENPTMEDVYRLNTLDDDHRIAVLPVDKNFHRALPFYPSDEDMDGQIILTALTVVALKKSLPIDGVTVKNSFGTMQADDVVLVTNDNGLAIRARERGLLTERYGYQYPDPYTGRRDLVVPEELFEEFYTSGYVSLETWTKYMPDEPDLVANEFLVMTPENNEYPEGYDPEYDWEYCNIGRYEVREEAVVRLRYLHNFPVGVKNAGQAIYAEALMDPNVSAVVCTGPAGTGKTYLATVYGYTACKKGEFIGVTVVPCDCKNTHGFLPGDLDEKMDPDVQPLKNALRNYLLNEDSKYRKELSNLMKFGTGAEGKKKAKSRGGCDDEGDGKRSLKVKLADRVDLIWSNWFSNIPICFARGRDFAHELAIFDEFQDQTVSQADTLIKRLGQDGKIIITGDIKQIHAPYIDETSSGLTYASRILMDSPMVAQVSFTEEEVIRHPLVKTIAMRQK
jgi:predicted ribonuclease YlaK